MDIGHEKSKIEFEKFAAVFFGSGNKVNDWKQEEVPQHKRNNCGHSHWKSQGRCQRRHPKSQVAVENSTSNAQHGPCRQQDPRPSSKGNIKGS